MLGVWVPGELPKLPKTPDLLQQIHVACFDSRRTSGVVP